MDGEQWIVKIIDWIIAGSIPILIFWWGKRELKKKKLDKKIKDLETEFTNEREINKKLKQEISEKEKEFSYKDLINKRDKQKLEKEIDKLKKPN